MCKNLDIFNKIPSKSWCVIEIQIAKLEYNKKAKKFIKDKKLRFIFTCKNYFQNLRSKIKLMGGTKRVATSFITYSDTRIRYVFLAELYGEW